MPRSSLNRSLSLNFLKRSSYSLLKVSVPSPRSSSFFDVGLTLWRWSDWWSLVSFSCVTHIFKYKEIVKGNKGSLYCITLITFILSLNSKSWLFLRIVRPALSSSLLLLLIHVFPRRAFIALFGHSFSVLKSYRSRIRWVSLFDCSLASGECFVDDDNSWLDSVLSEIKYVKFKNIRGKYFILYINNYYTIRLINYLCWLD